MEELKGKIDFKSISNATLIVFFGIEATLKVCDYSYYTYLDFLSKAVKSFVLLALVIFLIQKKENRFLVSTFLIFIICLIGQYVLDKNISVDMIQLIFRYLFPLFLFQTYNVARKEYSGEMFTLFKPFLLLNSILIILAFIFQIKVLKTYEGNRFGYNGLVNASATGTYLYMFAIFLYAQKAIKDVLIDWKDVLILISCLMIGTKSIYLVLFSALFYVCFYRFKSHRILIFSLFILVGSGLMYFILFKYGIFHQITSEHGFLTSLMSYRNQLLSNKTIPYVAENWGFVNYLFGGYTNPNLRSQMGLFDLIFMFGFLGAIYYLFLYKKTLFENRPRIDTYYFYIILFLLVFLSGNFFLYSLTQLMMLIYKDKNERINP